MPPEMISSLILVCLPAERKLGITKGKKLKGTLLNSTNIPVCDTFSTVRKSIDLPTPPAGDLLNSFISSMSKSDNATGIKVPVEAAIRLSILAHRNLRGKYREVGTKRATPEII